MGTTRAKLIYNPYAGAAANPNSRLADAVRCLERHGLKVDVAVVSPAEEATKAARQAMRGGYRLIIAMGGDGTIEAVARALIGHKARLGLLPAGTYNNVALSLGIPMDLEGACQVLQTGHRRRLDVGWIKNKKFGQTYFFEVAAVGIVAQLFPAANELAKHRWRKLAGTAGALIRFKAPKVRLRMDGGSRIQVDTPLVVVSNTPSWGDNALMAPEARLDDGLFDVSVYAGFSRPELLAYMARVAHEGHTNDGHVQRYRARKIKIKARPNQDAVADSQMMGKGSLTIKVRPRALRVIAPEQDVVRQQRARAVEQLLVHEAPGANNTPVTVSHT